MPPHAGVGLAVWRRPWRLWDRLDRSTRWLLVGAIPALTDPALLAAGLGVGVCSSVIPYITDQLAMARLSRGSYALLMSLLPATATVIGLAMLTQVPTPMETAGVALVVGAVAAHQDRTADPGLR